MTPQDIELFQQAITLAQATTSPLQKQQAHAILSQLVQRYPNESKIWLWLAFTAPSIFEAETALHNVQKLYPFEPTLPSAFAWLKNEQAKQKKASEAFASASSIPSDSYSYTNSNYNHQSYSSPKYTTSNSYLFPDSFSQKNKSAWEFELEDGFHSVELTKNEATKVETLLVDSVFARYVERGWWVGLEWLGILLGIFLGFWWILAIISSLKVYEFKLGPHICHIRKVIGFRSSYDLLIDGRSLKSKEFVKPTMVLPLWTAIFVIACYLVVFVVFKFSSLVIAIIGMWICVKIACNTARTTFVRIYLCSVVVAVCWIGAFILLRIGFRL